MSYLPNFHWQVSLHMGLEIFSVLVAFDNDQNSHSLTKMLLSFKLSLSGSEWQKYKIPYQIMFHLFLFWPNNITSSRVTSLHGCLDGFSLNITSYDHWKCFIQNLNAMHDCESLFGCSHWLVGTVHLNLVYKRAPLTCMVVHPSIFK